MRAIRNPGRVVGLWYLSLVLFGPLTLLYIPNKLFVHNDAARWIGVWLIINGAAYVALCVARVMVPAYADRLFLYFQPALFGELVIMLWLVIKGAGQTPPLGAPALPARR